MVKIRKEAPKWNQADVCTLDKWDDVQGQWFGAVVQKTNASFFLWSDSELWRVLGYFCIFSDPVLCCMMAFDPQKVVIKNQVKTSWEQLQHLQPERQINDYLIIHSSSIGLLSVLSLYQMSCFALSHWSQVHTLLAFHTVRGRTPCVVSVLHERRNSLQCSSSLELLVFSWSCCVHALPGEILIPRVLVSCLKAQVSVLFVWRTCPIHLSLEVIEVGCLWVNSPLLLEDVTESHERGGNHLWVLQGKNLVLQSCSMSPQRHQTLLWSSSQRCQVWARGPAVLQNWVLILSIFEKEKAVILSCQEERLDFASQALTCNRLLGWKCTEPTIDNFWFDLFFPLNTSEDIAWFINPTMAEETLQFSNLDRNSRIISWGHSDLDLWSQTRFDSQPPLAAAALCSHCSQQLC